MCFPHDENYVTSTSTDWTDVCYVFISHRVCLSASKTYRLCISSQALNLATESSPLSLPSPLSTSLISSLLSLATSSSAPSSPLRCPGAATRTEEVVVLGHDDCDCLLSSSSSSSSSSLFSSSFHSSSCCWQGSVLVVLSCPPLLPDPARNSSRLLSGLPGLFPASGKQIQIS